MQELREIHDPHLRQPLILGRSDSGVRVAFLPTPGFVTSAGYFGLRFGSADVRFRGANGAVTEVPHGSAHFLEHKLFEGRDEKVFDRFGRLGAQFNGGTGFYTTSYYFSSAGRFQECLDVLLDFVQHPLITAERVEKEKGIIAQEVRMYEDNPQQRGLFLLHQALYHRHPIRVPPGGYVDTVRETSAAHLQSCYDAFYRPSRLHLVLAGDFPPEWVFAEVERRLDPPRPGGATALYPPEERQPAAPLLEQEFAVSRPHLWIGWRDEEGPGLGTSLLRRWLGSSLVLELIFGASSAYREDLYQRGLADDTLRAYYSCDRDYGYALVATLHDQPERFLESAEQAIARFLDAGPAARDLERIRRATWGEVVSHLQAPDALASAVLHDLLNEQEPFSTLTLLEEVGLEEIHRRAREMFRPEQRAVALLRPAAG